MVEERKKVSTGSPKGVLNVVERAIRNNHQNDKLRNFNFNSLFCPKCLSRNIYITIELNINILKSEFELNAGNLINFLATCNDCGVYNSLLNFITGKFEEKEDFLFLPPHDF